MKKLINQKGQKMTKKVLDELELTELFNPAHSILLTPYESC